MTIALAVYGVVVTVAALICGLNWWLSDREAKRCLAGWHSAASKADDAKRDADALGIERGRLRLQLSKSQIDVRAIQSQLDNLCSEIQRRLG